MFFDLDAISRNDQKNIVSDDVGEPIFHSMSNKKPEKKYSDNFIVKPDTVYQLLSDARKFNPSQEEIETNKHKHKTNKMTYPKSLSFDSSAYTSFLLLILIVCSFFIFVCLGGCSSFKNLALMLLYRGKTGKLHWTKNGYTLIPQVNHKSA